MASRLLTGIVVGASIAIGGATVWLGNAFLTAERAPTPKGAIPDNTAEELDELRGRVAGLERRSRLRDFRQQFRETERDDASGSDEPGGLEAGVETQQPVRPRRTPQEVDEHAALVRQKLREHILDEGQDPVWAREVLDEIGVAFLQESLQAVSLIDAACGTTLCATRLRIDAETDTDEYERIQNQLLRERPFRYSSFFSPLGDGEYELVFTRKGAGMPPLNI